MCATLSLPHTGPCKFPHQTPWQASIIATSGPKSTLEAGQGDKLAGSLKTDCFYHPFVSGGCGIYHVLQLYNQSEAAGKRLRRCALMLKLGSPIGAYSQRYSYNVSLRCDMLWRLTVTALLKLNVNCHGWPMGIVCYSQGDFF